MVSVIVPIYKVEKYLNTCIESIVGQTYHELEIILVDDGSPDSCPTICDEWEQNDSRILVIHQTNKGVSGARNAGLDICTGDYILFLDGDDYLLPNAVEMLMEVENETGADMVMSAHRRVHDDENKCSVTKFDSAERVFVIDEKAFWKMSISPTMALIPVCPWGKLYSKKIWETLRFPIGKINEDVAVMRGVAANSREIACLNEITTCYRIVEGSIMHRKMYLERLDDSEFHLKTVYYLLEKGYVDIALYYWGDGERILVKGYTSLTGSEAKKRISELYKGYKDAARCLCKESIPLGKKIQLFMFNANLWTYVRIKKLFGR